MVLILGLVLCAGAPATGASGAGSSGSGERDDPEASAAAAQERAPCAERVARRVQRRYETIRDLRADFEQTTRMSALGGSPQAREVSSGVVTLAKPGRMRWEYQRPEPSLVVSDGESVWTFDPELQEAQKFPVGAGILEGAAVQFLLGRGDVLRDFHVTAGPCDASPIRLHLRPRAAASYERIELAVEPESGRILESVVHDLFGNVTRVTFSNVETDVGVEEETFVFVAPEGVRVLEMPAQR